MSHLFIGVAFLLWGASVGAMSITGSTAKNALLTIVGTIDVGDDVALRRRLGPAVLGRRVRVYIKSDGGDVATAMKIGRTLREQEASVSTDRCLSSCALVLIGGVQRDVFTKASLGMGVGLHRPYFSSLSAALSTSEVSEKRAKLHDELVAYIKEMNMTSRLLDLMEAIPPEKMKMLTADEVSDLGLNAPDPVWDEKDVAMEASLRATTSQEFRRRRLSAEAKCQAPHYNEPYSYERWENHWTCKEAVLLGVSVSQYRQREQIFMSATSWTRERGGNLSQSEVANLRRCRTRILALGELTCPR